MYTLRSRRLHTSFIVGVVLVFVLPAVWATQQNDAGSGGDAGNTAASAYTLPAFGTYTGSMVNQNDPDWYRASGAISGPHCVEARIPSAVNAPANANLSVTNTRWANSVFGTAGGTDLGVAVKSTASPRLGLSPNGNGSGPGGYGFTLKEYRATELGSGDGASGSDAGGVNSATEVVVPRPCFAGILLVSVNDMVDSFKTTTTDEDGFTLTFLHEGTRAVNLKVVRPDGSTLVTLRSGEMAQGVLEQVGTWHLLLEVTTDTVLEPIELNMAQNSIDIGYLIGWTRDDSGYRCRPMCVS